MLASEKKTPQPIASRQVTQMCQSLIIWVFFNIRNVLIFINIRGSRNFLPINFKINYIVILQLFDGPSQKITGHVHNND